MSAPFIRVPQSSSLVSARAHDFIDEANRVAADPDKGASLEQLEKSYLATKSAAGGVNVVDDPKDLVARLIKDNIPLWNKLLQNDFCQKHMKTQPKTDAKTLSGFKEYMQQDFLYIVHQCQYEADRGLKATTTADFDTSMDRVGKRANFGKDLLKTCTAAPAAGLGIKDSAVLGTHETTALKDYIAFQIQEANTQNWVISLVATVPCIQSYYLIAQDLLQHSAHKDTPWYLLWVKPNSEYLDSTKRQKQIFIDGYAQWKDHYPAINDIFKKAVQQEINLWGTAL